MKTSWVVLLVAAAMIFEIGKSINETSEDIKKEFLSNCRSAPKGKLTNYTYGYKVEIFCKDMDYDYKEATIAKLEQEHREQEILDIVTETLAESMDMEESKNTPSN